MDIFIQYQKEDKSWSDWTPCHLDGTKLMVHGEELTTSSVRVLKNKDLENPDVAWFARHDGTLYEINNIRGFIEKAIPLPEQNNNKTISVHLIPGDFSLEAFNEMKDSAKAYLKPPLLTLPFLDEHLIRPADTAQTMILDGIETPEQKAQNWWKDLYERYRKDVEAQLIQIIQDNTTERQQINALSDFLKAHYQFIQGTCLDYVAIPQHPVTMTLTRIAEMIAYEKPAIQLLMPGIATESLKEGYVNLTDLPIPFILQSHIALKEDYLAPVLSLIEYVQAPREKLYAPYTLEDYLPQDLSESDIQALFQHSSMTQELHDAFRTVQNLTTQASNLLGQLNILGQKLKFYDAHGGIGRGDNAASGAYPAIMDFMQYYLSLEPCALLINKTPPQITDLPADKNIGYAFYKDRLYFLNRHEDTVTPITEVEQSAKFNVQLARFKQLSDVPESMNLPTIVKTDDGQFTFFPGRKTLNQHDIQIINNNFPNEYQRIINCSESNIPKQVFDAIKTEYSGPLFAELFHQKFSENKTLSQEDLAWIDIHTEHSFMNGYTKVPEALRREIELLWQLFHNPAKNIEATRNMATCIGTRGESIRSLTQEHQRQLIDISASPEQQRHLLDEANQNLQSRLQELKAALDNQTYKGQDPHLSLNLDILNRFNKSISIQSMADVYILNTFAPKDLMVLLDSIPILKESLKSLLNEPENLIPYLNDTPEQTLAVILPLISEQLGLNVEQYPAMLGMLTPSKIDIILTSFQGHWQDLIKDAFNFTKIYTTLPVEHQQQLIESLQGHWQDLIKDAFDFKRIYLTLPEEHQQQLIEAFKEHWQDLIKKADEFNTIYKILPKEHQNQLFASFQGHWQDLIKGAVGFTNIYTTLSEEHQNQLFESFQGHWQDLIKNDLDFQYIYKTLSIEHQNQLFESFQGHWQDVIKDAFDFTRIYLTLPEEHQQQLIEAFKEHWQDVIKDAFDFTNIYTTLPAENQNQLIESFKEHWQDLIKDAFDFKRIYLTLPEEQQQQLIESYQGHWQDLIGYSSDFNTIYRTLSIEQQHQLIISLLSEALTKSHSIQDSLIDLLKSPSSDIWSDPVLQQVLITLNKGVQVLQKDYKPASIETFLKKLFSQDPEQIEKSPRALVRNSKSPILSCSMFSQNKPENINEILQTYFSEFLPQKGPDAPRAKI